MTNLRWRYVWRGIWLYRSRTILIVLSSAIGIFAFGLIIGAAATLRTELPARYQEVNPASATLHARGFDLPTVESVRRMPEVAVAEGRTSAVIQYRNELGEWHDLQLFVLEGVVISVMAWVGSIVLSQPMSRAMSYVVGMNFAKLPLSYVFDLRALPLWLLIAIVVSALSSLIPARAAARLSVRETLAYEG